jgi:hypothetical protein
MATPKPKTTNETELKAGVGASDGNSGGGAGAGSPDAEVGMQSDATNKGDRKEDKKKLFPDSTGEASKTGRSDVSNEETE